MSIKFYEYKGYTFIIKYNSKDGLYTAKCGSMRTYDANMDDLKGKIETVVHQNKDFKLSVDPIPTISKKKGE